MTNIVEHKRLELSLSDFITSTSALSRKNELSRIRQFEDWLQANNALLFSADLRAYRDYLLGPQRRLRPSSVNAHLKSIRGRYRVMMRSNAYRNALNELVATFAAANGMEITSIADQLALVNELEMRIKNQIFADDVFAREITKQDTADEESGLRLTEAQAVQLIRTPGLSTIRGQRDTAMIALMICTGLREHELAALSTEDLRVHYEGHLALRVRDGKGAKQRLIVYGNLAWCLVYVDQWLASARITRGPAFRGFWGKSEKLRPTPISVRTIARILNQYPIFHEGNATIVRPHDLRRTYARIQHDSGMKAEALQQNMGHAAYDTTLGYIGNLDAEQRRSRSTLPMPHTMQELQRSER